MDEQIKKAMAPLREFWRKQTPALKKIIVLVAAGVVLLSMAIVIWLNVGGSNFVTLYTGLDRAEATSVYNVLEEMTIPAQMDENGNVLVPKEQVDKLRLELAAKGYPKTGLTYDIFSSVNGLTTTESDKKVYLTQQLQQNMVQTLSGIEGVQKSVVMLNIASGSNYVWEQDTQKSTASVLLTLEPGFEMNRKQVAAIKLIVARGAPKLATADVAVIDAATSMELTETDPDVGSLMGELERLGFERQIEKAFEDKAARQLSLFYNADQLRVSATVVLNYDKMISESMQYKPEQGGTGVIDHIDERYAMNANGLAEGIPGEDANTDIPIIVDQDNDGVPEYIDHTRSIDYAISHIKQQIEKGKAEITSSSIAIMVKDGDLNQQKRDSIIEQVSKATNISVGNISVETLELPAPTEDSADTTPSILDDPILLAVIGLGVLSLLVIIFLVARMIRKKKKMTHEEVDELGLEQQRMQQEMEDKKRALKDAAEAKNHQENAIANEVRTFAKENPEITAGLIRSWLKEDE